MPKLKTCGKKGHSKCSGRSRKFKGFIETPFLIEVEGTDHVRPFQSGVKGLPHNVLVAGKLHRKSVHKAIITAMSGPNEFGVVSSSELEGEPFQLKSLKELVYLLECNPNRTYFVEQPRDELMSLAAVCNESY